MGWMPAAIAGSSVLGAGSSLAGSGKASSGAKEAAGLQRQQFDITRNLLQPWVSEGGAALGNLMGMLPGTLTQAQLEAMPGYQFILNQGLKATQSAQAAKGLGVSGSALKGAATYATGLADNTYTQAFNQQQTKFKDVFDIANMGENAAAGVGTAGAKAAEAAGNYLNQAGQAGAAGVQGVGSAATGAAQNALQYSLLDRYLQTKEGGGGSLTGYDQPWNTSYAGGQGGRIV